MLDAAGWAGMMVFIAAYFGVSAGKLKTDSVLYQGLNFGGAIAVGASVFAKKAWPAFALEVVWGSIAIFGLCRLWAQRRG
jgi:hypothetical protein